MTNSGAGTKFVPVNLNRSYGHNNSNGNSSQHSTSQYGGSRARTGGGSGGGSMLVLSRPRSSQKNSGPKLSVPPPLNLPSLRKEHQRFDSSGSNSGSAGGGASGVGSRPGSSGVGWTKSAVLAATTTQEVKQSDASADPGAAKGTTGGGSSYVPPSARAAAPTNSCTLQGSSGSIVDNVSVLKGEDFPSLKAALPAGGALIEKKQRDGVGQKQKPVAVAATTAGLRNGSSDGAIPDVQPLSRLKRNDVINETDSDDKQNYDSIAGLVRVEKARKGEDYLPGLPSVRISTRSDWEDDERDTAHTFVEKGRDHGFTMNEAYWERDFDFRRPSIFPLKPMYNVAERRGHSDNTSKVLPVETSCKDSNSKDMRTSSRDGISKSLSALSKEGYYETGSERNSNILWPSSKNGEVFKETINSFFPSRHSRDDSGRRDGKQPFVNKMDSIGGRGSESDSRENNNYDQQGRHRGDSLQNKFFSKSTFPFSGAKVLPRYDSVPNSSRDKYDSVKSGKNILDDAFVKDMWMNDFNGKDPFSVGLIGLMKKKKDILKKTDFHDPVRESFEAELERVQKMQELERQRNIEELERALEIPRREEEERIRLAKEHEEHQRRLEEQAQEAAWRAEQERLEALHKAEEQRVAREEEKRKFILEEERRKQAARQKLLELEEKIARRQAEAATYSHTSDVIDEKSAGTVLEREYPKVPDVKDLEDAEVMVEKCLPSVSTDSSIINQKYGPESKPETLSALERGKAVSSLKRDMDMGNGTTYVHHYPEKELRSPRWDASLGGKLYGRREFQSGPGLIPIRGYHNVGNSDMRVDDQGQSNNQKWNRRKDDEQYRGTIELEFQHNPNEEAGNDVYHQRIYHRLEAEGMYSSVRPRLATKQPRVLPPPSFNSIQAMAVREAGSSDFMINDGHQMHDSEDEAMPNHQKRDSCGRESAIESNVDDIQNLDTDSERQNFGIGSARCDSQSSFSISSPPDTPAQMSHDDLEESREFPIGLTAKDDVYVEGNEVLNLHMGIEKDTRLNSSIGTAEEEWAIGNGLQEPDEYDEDESYEAEDDAHDHDDENLKLAHKFEGMNLDLNASASVDNLVLCFNEGVRMPNDEVENSSINDDDSNILREVSMVKPKDQDFFALGSNIESPHSIGTASANIDTLRIVDSENAVDDYSTELTSATQQTLASDLENQVAPQSVLPNHSMPSVSNQSVQSTVGSVSALSEVPINLQFGLFSGPPLIPSPVPAIQIGSIQMPLHMHNPPLGSSVANVHPSQPPLFHFGHLRYTPHISHGMLALGSHVGSFGQPATLVQDDSSIGITSKDEPVLSSRETGRTVQHLSCDPSDNVLKSEIPESTIQSEGSDVKNLTSTPVPDMLERTPGGSLLPVSGTKRRNHKLSKIQGPSFSGRGRRYIITAKSASRSLLPTPDMPFHDLITFQNRSQRQRSEFRVRDGFDKIHNLPVSTYVNDGNDKSNCVVRNAGPRASVRQMPNRQLKSTSESKGSKVEAVDTIGKNVSEKRGHSKVIYGISRTGENIDASLKEGIVRVFEQPGIEAPSDDDDFIKVRSKRQMLNERRAKREKEIKAKPRVTKISKRIHSTSRRTPSMDNVGLLNSLDSDCSGGGIRNSGLLEASGVKATVVSQPLPPIGTPALKSNVSNKVETIAQHMRTTQMRPIPGGIKNLSSEYNSDDKLDNIHTSLGSWGNSHIQHEVITLTQTQLDEAMQPDHFDSRLSGDSTTKVNESTVSGSTLTKEKRFPSSASPISSLLAGERIQFGAVTSPTILPPVSSPSHGIGLPGPRRSTSEDVCSLFFEKEKLPNECNLRLQDRDAEAEAEAAASAVAVAAISNDENNLVSVPLTSADANNLGGGKRDAMVAEVGCLNQANQARHDEPFNVALPADLSVETPIPMWPPLSSPQICSSSMLAQVPGGLPGHFPFYEMNPVLGGRIFAPGQHDESSASPSQSQKSNVPISGSLGTWQHHSNIDSIYGPPGGFTGPFIGPPGSVPGIQGPAHMVVYNHFAPVGQFGQVGLSFMGTAYVPSGKQPDWKHIPSTSSVIVGESELHSMNAVSGLHNPLNIPASMQHIAPRSALHSLVSPVAMFDVSSLQASPEAGQARWSHAPSASPLQSAQASMALQLQGETGLPLSNHRAPVCQQLVESRLEPAPDKTRNFPSLPDSTITQLPDELGMQEVASANATASTTVVASSSDGCVSDSTGEEVVQRRSENVNSSLKPHASGKILSNQQYNGSSVLHHQKYGFSPRNSGGEWSHRRTGYLGRNHSSADTSFSQLKTKQIYVAKQSASGAPPIS